MSCYQKISSVQCYFFWMYGGVFSDLVAMNTMVSSGLTHLCLAAENISCLWLTACPLLEITLKCREMPPARLRAFPGSACNQWHSMSTYLSLEKCWRSFPTPELPSGLAELHLQPHCRSVSFSAILIHVHAYLLRADPHKYSANKSPSQVLFPGDLI